MGIKNLSLGAPDFGLGLMHSVKHYEIKTMLLMQETLLGMAQSVL